MADVNNTTSLQTLQDSKLFSCGNYLCSKCYKNDDDFDNYDDSTNNSVSQVDNLIYDD